mgnify:CR=1 FL=1
MNLNDKVRVRLTKAGARVAALANEDPRQDVWQLWELMMVFGPKMHNGSEQFFELNEITEEPK